MSPASRLLQSLASPGDSSSPALLCAAVGRRPSRGERLPLRESAPLVVLMSLTLWCAVGALVWLVVG